MHRPIFQFQGICIACSFVFIVYACQPNDGKDKRTKKQTVPHVVKKDSLFVSKDTIPSSTVRDSLSVDYRELEKHLVRYQLLAKQGGWEQLLPQTEGLALGDSSNEVVKLKRQLYLLSDLPYLDTSMVYDSMLKQGVTRFQNRYGLRLDGIVGAQTLHRLRIPIQKQIHQIQVNLKRLKQAVPPISGDYLVVNIPAFRLYVYQSNALLWSCKVVVGQAVSHKRTVVFNDKIEYIVFSPYWNIPQTIVIQQIIPNIKKDNTYLTEYGIEALDASGKVVPTGSINWSNYTTQFPYRLRQKPGKNNALGSVKFMFPNKYAIYLHDTPQKMLFGSSKRSFSHGCIRVQQPLKLAQFLLRNEKRYSQQVLRNSMSAEQEVVVRLKRQIPVSIVYYTVWVDRGGVLNFRNDVYRYD